MWGRGKCTIRHFGVCAYHSRETKSISLFIEVTLQLARAIGQVVWGSCEVAERCSSTLSEEEEEEESKPSRLSLQLIRPRLLPAIDISSFAFLHVRLKSPGNG